MPTALRVEGFRFFFYSNEREEPPHIHVESGDGYAKFWLAPEIAPADSDGYNATELRRLLELVEDHQEQLLEAWNAHRQPR